MRRNRVDIMGISEMEWELSVELVRDEFRMFYSSGESKGSHGVGVLLGSGIYIGMFM